MSAVKLLSIVAVFILTSGTTAGTIIEFDNTPLSSIGKKAGSVLIQQRRFGLAPFDYLCTSMQCIYAGKQRNSAKEVPYETYAAPYKAIFDLEASELIEELGLEHETRLSKMLFIERYTRYSHAFLPKDSIHNFDENRFVNFYYNSGKYVFQAVEVEIPQLALRGLAICKSRLGMQGEGTPLGCVMVAIFNSHENLYRAIIAKRGNDSFDPFISAAYADVERPDELDVDTSTDSWTFNPAAPLIFDDTCYQAFPIILSDELANDKSLLFEKDRFSVSASNISIEIEGETVIRKSLWDDTRWETLAVFIEIKQGLEKKFIPEISLFGYISKNVSTLRKPPDLYYQHYSTKIMDALRRSYAKACPQ